MTYDPINSVIDRLRLRDLMELSECGISKEVVEYQFRNAQFFQIWASKINGEPTAMMAFHELTPKTVLASLLATEDWPHVVRDVVKAVPYIKHHLLHGKKYTRAECRTMEGHDDAIRLLEHLGFRQEARLPLYGKTGKAFLQYAWTLGADPDGDAAFREQRQHERDGLRSGADSANESVARTSGVGIAGAKTVVH